MIPEIADPRWRRILLSDATPKFSHLTTQLMYSRVRMILKMDPSPSSLTAAIQTVREYFVKNSSKVQIDLQSLIQEMERVHG